MKRNKAIIPFFVYLWSALQFCGVCEVCAQSKYEFKDLEPATILPALFSGKYTDSLKMTRWLPDAEFYTKFNNQYSDTYECETTIREHRTYFFENKYSLNQNKRDSIRYVFFETTTRNLPQSRFWTYDMAAIGLAKFQKAGKMWKLLAFDRLFSSGIPDRGGMPSFKIIPWDSTGSEHLILETCSTDMHPNYDDNSETIYYSDIYSTQYSPALTAYASNNELYVFKEEDKYANQVNIEIQPDKERVIVHKVGTNRVYDKKTDSFKITNLDEHKVYRLDKASKVFTEVVR